MKVKDETVTMLANQLRSIYPYVTVEESVIRKYVRSCKDEKTVSVHLLYDYVLSQGLCEVEE